MARIEPDIISAWEDRDMVYRRIRDLREDNDYTQQQVADILLINRRTYSGYETGTRMIPPEILIGLADLYGVTVDYLLGRAER